MSDDPWRKAFWQMMGVLSELDKNQIVLKLRGARLRKRAATGRCEGRKPYGFWDGEREVIQRMRELRAKELGFDRMAARLSEEKISARSGARWHGLTANNILSLDSQCRLLQADPLQPSRTPAMPPP